MSSFAHHRISGNFAPGVQVSDTQFIGVLSLEEAIQYGLTRPSIAEDATLREMKKNDKLAHAATVREMVQRRFDAARRKRATLYAHYMDGLNNGTVLGGVPPLTLYCDTVGTPVDGGLMLPLNSALVAIDGETQTEARFMRRERASETAREAMGVVIYHGITAQHAAVVMHDFNYYAHPVKEKAVAALNHNGAVTKVVHEVIKLVGLRGEEVQRIGSRLSKAQLTSVDRLLAGAVGCVAPDMINSKGGLAKALTAFNTGQGTIIPEHVQPFLTQAIDIARQDRACAVSPPALWAVAGAVSTKRGQPISLAEWQSIATLFANGGTDKLGRAFEHLAATA